MKNLSITLFALCLLILISCEKDGPKLNSYRAVVDQGGTTEEPAVSSEVTDGAQFEEERDGKMWKCKTETVNIQDAGGGNEGFPLFSPNSNVIYPGSLLQGASLSKGTPDIIAVKRAGGKISTDVVDGNIQSSFEVGNVTKSEVTDAINNIISTSTGVVPANFNISIKNIQSREQFALELGVDVNSTFVDIESKLNYSSDVSRNTFMVNLNQSFYTMSYDIPTSLDEIFDPSVTPEDLARYVGEGNPATYISDVTYGRIYYMMISSTSSVTEMDLAINGSFNGVATKVDADLETSYMSSLNDLTISVFAYGGLSTSALLTVGQTDIAALRELLAEGSNIQSGKAISYVVRSVYDNQIVSTQLATTYDVTNCKPTGIDGPPPYTEHWTGQVLDKMGPIGAAYNTYDSEIILINRDGNMFMRSNVGSLEGPFPIDELGIEACPFSGIGAACNLNGNQDGKFYLMAFDLSGTQYSYMNPDGKWGSVESITNLAYGTGPFNLTGINAMCFRSRSTNGPSSRYMWNNTGDKYSAYLNNPQSFGTVYNTWQWGPDYSLPFQTIGAAVSFYLGDEHFYIHFNKIGTHYSIYGNLNGRGTEVIGPFDL